MEQTLIPCEDDALALMAGMPDVATVRQLESYLLALPQIDLATPRAEAPSEVVAAPVLSPLPPLRPERPLRPPSV